MRKTIIVFFVLISVNTFSQNKKWTLKECVDYALENNISVKQSELDLDQSEINKRDAFGNYLPSINGSANHSWNVGLNQNITTGIYQNLTTQYSSVGLNGGLDIYGGLRNLYQYNRAKLDMLAAQYKLDDMKDNVSLYVANSFLQILFNKEQLSVLQSQQNVSNQEYERTKDMVDAGALPKGDLLEIQATIATQQQQIVNAENILLISKIQLAQLLLIKDYSTFDIVDSVYEVPESFILDESPEAIINKAKETRYNIKIAENSQQMAEYDLKLARAAYQPTLRAFFGYNTRASYSDQIAGFQPDPDNPSSIVQIGTVQSTGEPVVSEIENKIPIITGPDPLFDQFSLNDGYNYGFSLSIPIFNGLSVRNNVSRNKVNVERSKYQLEQANLDIETNVYQAYNDARGALKAYEAAQKTLLAREEAYNYSRERYNVGLLNAFDFNQSQNRYEAAQSDVIRTKYDYIFKLKVLEFYFGIPITDIN